MLAARLFKFVTNKRAQRPHNTRVTLAGGTSAVTITEGVHDTDATSGVTPLCNPPWHVLHLFQDTYRTASTEVSMYPLTNYCCLRVPYQYPTLHRKPVRANINNFVR